MYHPQSHARRHPRRHLTTAPTRPHKTGTPDNVQTQFTSRPLEVASDSPVTGLEGRASDRMRSLPVLLCGEAAPPRSWPAGPSSSGSRIAGRCRRLGTQIGQRTEPRVRSPRAQRRAGLARRARQRRQDLANATSATRPPDDFANLEVLAARLTAFEHRYNDAARAFDWRFNRDDLHRLLDRIAS